MRVKIDQARRDDQSGDIANRFALKPSPELSHTSILETDIHDGIDSLGGIDHAPATQDQIKGHAKLSFGLISRRTGSIGLSQKPWRSCRAL